MGEASQMSEVSQSEMSTASGGAAPGGEGGSKGPVIVVAIVLLLLVGGLIYFVTSSGGESDVTGGEDGGGGFGGDGTGGVTGGGLGSAPPQKPPPPPKTTDDPSAPPTGNAPGPMPPSVPTPPPVPPPPPGPPVKKYIKLVCTFGMTGVLESQIPPDKMCDFIFYTHMYYDIRKAITFQYGDLAGSHFKKAAKSYTTTAFGASLALSLTPTYAPAEKDSIKRSMESLINEKIMHFGALNVDVRDYNAAKSGGLQYLKVVGEVLRGKTSDHHCALGIFNASDGASLVSTAMSAANDFPEITMLILEVHSEKASQPSKLYTMPPNPDNEDVSNYDMIPLKDVKSHLSSLTDLSNRGRYVMLSVGMFARAYQTNAGQLGIANTSAVFDYHSACVCESGVCERRTGPPYDSMDVTVSVWNQKTMVFFDNIDQLKTKAQSRLDALPKNFSGIAAYNVEMDDFAAKCGSSKFARLSAIRERIDHALNS